MSRFGAVQGCPQKEVVAARTRTLASAALFRGWNAHARRGTSEKHGRARSRRLGVRERAAHTNFSAATTAAGDRRQSGRRGVALHPAAHDVRHRAERARALCLGCADARPRRDGCADRGDAGAAGQR
eukprot:5062157-Prymnesium_polylepis.1